MLVTHCKSIPKMTASPAQEPACKNPKMSLAVIEVSTAESTDSGACCLPGQVETKGCAGSSHRLIGFNPLPQDPLSSRGSGLRSLLQIYPLVFLTQLNPGSK